MPDFLHQLLQQTQSAVARSNTVSPSAWVLGTVLLAWVGLIYSGAPPWISVLLAALAVLTVVNFLASYWYFAWTNPECLRSEKFTLTKLAIEHSAKGDNISGMIDGNIVPAPPELELKEVKQ